MILLKLSANKESFHPVTFNRKGLSLIVGRKHNPEVSDIKKTYNGVGKSLLINIIHFCLGSSASTEFENKIPDWEFSLEFEIDGQVYIARRNTSRQDYVYLNNDEFTLKEFKNLMLVLIFNINPPIPFLTFRPLISRFIRPRKESYVKFDLYVDKEQDFNQLLCNAYLLGLDINRVLKKHELRGEENKVRDLRKNIKKDEIVKQFLTDNEDVSISLIDIKDRMSVLEKNLKNLKVATDYHNIQEEANKLSFEIKTLENESVILQNAVKNIDKTLEIKTDISQEDIYKMYEDAEYNISEAIKEKIDSVIEFHKKLITDRERRLNGEKKKLERKMDAVNKVRVEKGNRLDDLLKYLDTHGALEELNSLNSQLADLRLKFTKLSTYKNLIAEYDNKISNINIEFETENINTIDYLNQSKTLLDQNLSIFRNYSKQFYEDRPGGIDVVNNEGKNTLRYNIEVKIQDDASDGINEVKMFCFDFTLLRAKHNHDMRFIFHDSRLFGNMDSRQLTTLFKVAYNDSNEKDFQYISSLNEKDLSSISSELDSDVEFKKIILDNIVLELTDESEATKLLGIEVDMNY